MTAQPAAIIAQIITALRARDIAARLSPTEH